MANYKIKIPFEVTGRQSFIAYIYRDWRGEFGQVVVGFTPFLTQLPGDSPHEVSDDAIRRAARKIAIKLVSKFTGMPEDQLTTLPEEGVGSITVVPVSGEFPQQKQ